MPQSEITSACAAEATALTKITVGLTDNDIARPSPCPPWTVADLLCHVVIAVGRIDQALVEPDNSARDGAPDDAVRELVSTRGYYRPDQRFSAATNADRIQTAKALARQLGSAAAISSELAARWRPAVRLLEGAPADRTIRTRHGDRMLLADFACTRVVELALHGLDLAAGLGRDPWMTRQAADVLEHLLLPAGHGDRLQALLGCDQVGLIARLTGRSAVTPAEAALVDGAGAVVLSLG